MTTVGRSARVDLTLATKSPLGVDGLLDLHLLATEGQARSRHIRYNRFSLYSLNKRNGGKANRPRAQYEHDVVGADAGTGDGMATDAQRLDQCQRIERELFRAMGLREGNTR